MNPSTPNDLIKQSPMGWYQYAIVAICVLTYAADGLDVVTLSYAAPSIIKEWGISTQMFGWASTATPIGIAIGSIFISPFADRIGRRVLTLWLLGLLIGLLFATAMVGSIGALMGLRLVTGMCLGALVVCLNVTVSEFSNAARSNVFIGILHTGYSAGGMLCGALAAVLIEPFGWRAIFMAAATLNLLSFVLALFLLAESPAFLGRQRKPGALERLNRLMARLGKPALDALPDAPVTDSKKPGASIIPRAMWVGTGLLCLAGFAFTIAGGFMAGWRPQILAIGGLNMTWNGIAGMTTYGAGIVAHLIVGGLARRVGEVRIAVIFLLAMGGAFTLLGAVPDGMTWALIAASTLCGFFNVGSYTALVLVTLNYHDVTTRNAGLGIMMGFSRVGGIIGPLLGGYVIGAGAGRFWVMLLFGGLMIIPAIAAVLARMRAGPNSSLGQAATAH
ncbi:MFS transporter [Sphingomonas gei]|nr:MFS transporter [Sphingomonas gei]